MRHSLMMLLTKAYYCLLKFLPICHYLFSLFFLSDPLFAKIERTRRENVGCKGERISRFEKIIERKQEGEETTVINDDEY